MIAGDKFLLCIVIAINIIGTMFGFWYYRYQLASTPVHKIIFVPDCPTYTILMAVILALYLAGKKTALFAEVTFFGLIKYGFWTVLVLSLYQNYYFFHDPVLYAVLFVLHLGMIAEAWILPQIFRFSGKGILVALAWFIASDVMDYFFGTAPYLPDASFLGFLAAESFFVSGALFLYSRRYVS